MTGCSNPAHGHERVEGQRPVRIHGLAEADRGQGRRGDVRARVVARSRREPQPAAALDGDVAPEQGLVVREAEQLVRPGGARVDRARQHLDAPVEVGRRRRCVHLQRALAHLDEVAGLGRLGAGRREQDLETPVASAASRRLGPQHRAGPRADDARLVDVEEEAVVRVLPRGAPRARTGRGSAVGVNGRFPLAERAAAEVVHPRTGGSGVLARRHAQATLAAGCRAAARQSQRMSTSGTGESAASVSDTVVSSTRVSSGSAARHPAVVRIGTGSAARAASSADSRSGRAPSPASSVTLSSSSSEVVEAQHQDPLRAPWSRDGCRSPRRFRDDAGGRRRRAAGAPRRCRDPCRARRARAAPPGAPCCEIGLVSSV